MYSVRKKDERALVCTITGPTPLVHGQVLAVSIVSVVAMAFVWFLYEGIDIRLFTSLAVVSTFTSPTGRWPELSTGYQALGERTPRGGDFT